jgi:hypothetical protein
MLLGSGLVYHVGNAATFAFDFDVYFNKYKDRTGNDEITYRLGGGVEWLAGGKVALRAGASWDSGRPATYVHGGIGYVGQTFAVDLGYKQQVDSGVEAQLVLGVRIFLE